MKTSVIAATVIVGGLMIGGLSWALGIHPIYVMAVGVAGFGALVAYEKIVYKL